MHLTSAILLAAAALPAFVVADHQGFLQVPTNSDLASKLLRRGTTCTRGKDDAKCLKPGFSLGQTGSCPFPYSNDPKQPGYDVVVRRGAGICGADGKCDCTLLGLQNEHEVILDACRDLLARQDSSWHVVDACTEDPDLYCDVAGPSRPDSLDGTDVTVSEGHKCKNGQVDPSVP